MVDHRADEDGDFRIYATEDEPHPLSWSVVRSRISNWLRPPTPAAEGQAIAKDGTHLAAERPAAQRAAAHARSQHRTGHAGGPLSDWFTPTRIAIGVTLLWLAALGAYGMGYFVQVQDETGAGAGAAIRGLPTAELLFFAFAICGPVAMIWTAAVMLNRAERMTEAIAIQSESVLALATTISTLHDGVEALSQGTAARVEDTCAQLERNMSAGTARLTQALSEIEGKVDTTILDSVITLDKSNRERLLKVEQTLDAERSAFADRLDGDAKRLTARIEGSADETKTTLNQAIADAVAEQRTRMAEASDQLKAALEVLSAELAQSIQARGAAMDETLTRQQKAIDDGIERHQQALDDGIKHQAEALETGLDHQRQVLSDGLKHHQQVVGDEIEQHRTALSTGVEQHRAALDKAADETRNAIGTAADQTRGVIETAADQTRGTIETAAEGTRRTIEEAAESGRKAIETDLLEPIGAIRSGLESAAHAIALNPPATAAELATLLGDAADVIIRPEREVLTQTADKIVALEQQARSLIAQIDRTARMTAALQDGSAAPGDGPEAPLTLLPDARIDDQELPFADLPRTAFRAPLDWTAVIQVLDGAKPRASNKVAMKTAGADPDIRALVKAMEAVGTDLAEDGVFLDDLRPDHAPTALWARFAQGERGEAFKPLAGIDDDIALAIVRGRLRRAPDFRSSALRFVTVYIAVLQRIIAEVGADQRLIEIAETKAGRAFQVLAEPMGILEGASVSFDA